MKKTTIILNDNLTIQKAGEIKTRFLDTINSYDEISLQFEMVEKVDLSFFQLVCALHKTAIKQNKKIEITGTVPEIIIMAGENLGFKKDTNCPFDIAACLW